MPKLKKGWIICIAIIIIFIALNPTYLNFKEFTGLSGKDADYLHKKSNFLIFSIYKNDADEKSYVGILKNFIDITAKKGEPAILQNQIDSTEVIRMDTMKMDTSK